MKTGTTIQRFPRLLVLVLAVSALTACSEKKKNDDIIAPKVEAPKPKAPIRMQDYKAPSSVTWLGKPYQVEISRRSDDSLHMVKDENGQKYVDNRIAVRIVRADGSVFFSRTFAKSDFSSVLTAQYQRSGLLESVVFDRVDGNHLLFAGSICLPGSEDEFIPFDMTVSNFGEVVIKKAEELDTSGAAAEEDEV